MKVAMYNVTTGVVKGGIETFCIKTSEELVKRGVDARIICGAEGKAPETFERNGVRYHAFPFRRREEFPDFGTRFRKLCKRLSFARNCFEFLRKENFDIIHVHKPFEFPVMYVLKKRGSGSKIVFGSHGTDFFMSDKCFLGKTVDAAVTCSRFNAGEVYRRYGIEPVVIYNGADEKIFRPIDLAEARRKLGLRQDTAYIGTVGRLVGWKGIQVLLKAMPSIMKECPRTALLIIGDGEYRPALERLAGEYGIGDAVSFVGRIEHDALPEWINALDMLIQPSIGDEGFSVTVVEAMSCGKPVVATPSGGTSEILRDGETGFIVPKRDDSLLAERITTLIKNKNLAAGMGMEARQRVIAEFTWEKVASRLIQVYERVFDGDPVLS